jgi:hypothetical protein
MNKPAPRACAEIKNFDAAWRRSLAAFSVAVASRLVASIASTASPCCLMEVQTSASVAKANIAVKAAVAQWGVKSAAIHTRRGLGCGAAGEDGASVSGRASFGIGFPRFLHLVPSARFTLSPPDGQIFHNITYATFQKI